jgi:hypothetical protein
MRVALMTTTTDLKALCREGFIEIVQPSASTRSRHFVLKEPPLDAPTAADQL